MFKLVASRDYLAEVRPLIVQEDGSVKEEVFHLRFKRFESQALIDFSNRVNVERLSDIEVSREVVTNFGGDVLSAEGVPLEFSEQNFNALLAIHPVASAIARRFFASSNPETYEVAKVKNSEVSPATS